jgi:hypothetical protein
MMFENEMRLVLTKMMSERVFLLQNFFERAEIETDLSYVGSVAVAMFSEAIGARLNGFATVGCSAAGHCSCIHLDDAHKQIYGKKHEVVVVTPVADELVAACQDVMQGIDAKRPEDAMLWSLFYLSETVKLLDAKHELFYAGENSFQYVPLDAFGKFRPLRAH